MTDKELIQLYKMCSEHDICEGCPERNDFGPCLIDRYCDLDDLIPRLEALLAENEHLREVTKMVGKDTNVPTNADHIRAMSDEELMGFLWQFNDDSFENVMPFCKNTVECGEKVDSGDISTEMCKRCLLDKLQQPYESEGTPCST